MYRMLAQWLTKVTGKEDYIVGLTLLRCVLYYDSEPDIVIWFSGRC